MPTTTVTLSSGTADLTKSQFGIVYSVDGKPGTGYQSADLLEGRTLDHFHSGKEVEAYGATWHTTDCGASDMRYLAEESPDIRPCEDCYEGTPGTLHPAEQPRGWGDHKDARFVPSGQYGPCGTCHGKGEVNHSWYADLMEVKVLTCCTFDSLLDFWENEGFGSHCENTMGTMGAPMPDAIHTWAWMPAFALNGDSGDMFQSAYVTPYPFDADGEPLTELTEADFDAMQEAVERYRREAEEERVAKIRARKTAI